MSVTLNQHVGWKIGNKRRRKRRSAGGEMGFPTEPPPEKLKKHVQKELPVGR